jgi:protein-tyrosine phosphatase
MSSVNYRDLADIRSVEGEAARSGVLERGTAFDSAKFQGDVLLDLRSSAERLDFPVVGATPMEVSADRRALRTSAHPRARDYVNYYCALLPEAADVAGSAILQLARGHSVGVFCTSGKDRTGVVVAIVLSALGALRSEVVSDYAASWRTLSRVSASRFPWASSLTREDYLARVRAYPTAMAGFLDSVEDRHGSASSLLLERGLARTDLNRARIRFFGSPDA